MHDSDCQELAKISEIEADIDRAFADNPLADRPYAQAMWTLLSAAEDMHFRNVVISRLSDPEMSMFVDGVINALTYPARTIHARSERKECALPKELVDDDYTAAIDWINSTEDYLQYCSIFPLFRAGKINIQVNGDELVIEHVGENDTRYEAYDRFVGKRDSEKNVQSDPNLIVRSLGANLVRRGQQYDVKFTNRLMAGILRVFSEQYSNRFVLPPNWNFLEFSLAHFKSVMVCLQSVASAWMVARQIFASSGVLGVGYASSVWTPTKEELQKLLEKHANVPSVVIQSVLRYLTFGEMEIRNPDVATQPIIDLFNGRYAISPLLLMHINAERNLCVLLNQVPAERENYSKLVDQKEGELISSMRSQLSRLGYEILSAHLDTTDVDISIIDRKTKICLCVELKWFIEPAEIREVNARSQELKKGVSQCLKLRRLFANRDQQLFASLDIDSSYNFLAVVGSANFIGRSDIQCGTVPIIKVWHLVKHLREKNLSDTIQWLTQHDYLPKEGVDYKVIDMPVKVARWKARWYGFRTADPGPDNS